MKVIVVHRPGHELPGAPIKDVVSEMQSQGIKVDLIPLSSVPSNSGGDLVFMYNTAYRVQKKKIDAMGLKVFNVPACGYGKHNQYPCLKEAGVSIPDFEVIGSNTNIDALVSRIGLPLITKPSIGSGGRGVALHKEATSIRARPGKDIIIAQKYVPEASRGDIRALVIDGEVVASLWRTPKKGSIASNFHSGGQPSKYTIREDEREQAIRAARATGLSVSGVDIVPTENGPLVFEANSLPDFMHMKSVAKVDPIPNLVAALKKAAQSS